MLGAARSGPAATGPPDGPQRGAGRGAGGRLLARRLGDYRRDDLVHDVAMGLLVTALPITDVDMTAADAHVQLDDELAARGIRLVFAELKGR